MSTSWHGTGRDAPLSSATWSARLEFLLDAANTDAAPVDRSSLRPGANAYVVPAFDWSALQFSLPVRIDRDPASIGLASAGLDGATAVAIEAVKAAALEPSAADLGPLSGRGTEFPHRYQAPT